MGIIIDILIFIIVLGGIVAIHELGHLIFAKKANILCFEYAIGMGPIIYKKKNKETDFTIRAIPIGGFVSMAGEQMSTEMIKKDQIIGINLEENIIKDIVLTEKVESQFRLQVTDFEIYNEHDTGMFIEGYKDGELVRYEISEEAYYHISEKQQYKIAPYKRSFESKTFIQKFLTLVAGPGMNFLLAILLFFLVAAFQGKPLDNNIIGKVKGDMPAAAAGFERKDEIISVEGHSVTDHETLQDALYNLSSYENVELILKKKDGATKITQINLMVTVTQLGIANHNDNYEVKTSNNGAIVGKALIKAVNKFDKDTLKENDIITAITYNEQKITVLNWFDLIQAIKTLNIDGGVVLLDYIQDDENKTIEIEAWENKVLVAQSVTSYSITMGYQKDTKFNFLYSITQPFKEMWHSFMLVVNILVLLFGGSKQVGVSDLSGPIGIFSIVSQVRSNGVLALLSFTAFLSVNVGVLNLLPIPVLDGGRIVFISIEAVTKKKIPRKVENLIINIFFILMMVLFVYVAFNDIIRLIFG